MEERPDIKYRASAEREDALVELQRKILTNAVAYVKPGGVLLYSTCTVNYAENQGNAKWLAGNFPLEPESLDPFLPQELRTETPQRISSAASGGAQLRRLFYGALQKKENGR